MAEEETKVTIDVWGTKKPEGQVDKAKATKDEAAPPAAEGEVEGHHWHGHHHWHGGGPFWRVGVGGGGGGGGGWTRCWNCGSVRFVRDAYPGQVFICGNCGTPYTPY